MEKEIGKNRIKRESEFKKMQKMKLGNRKENDRARERKREGRRREI